MVFRCGLFGVWLACKSGGNAIAIGYDGTARTWVGTSTRQGNGFAGVLSKKNRPYHHFED